MVNNGRSAGLSKNRHVYGLAKNGTSLGASFFSLLLPVEGESEVYYVDLVLHVLVPAMMCFIISIPVKWKTDVAVMIG